MITKAKILSDVFPYPHALYHADYCLYHHDTQNLSYFEKMLNVLQNNSEKDTIQLLETPLFVIAGYRFSVQQQPYHFMSLIETQKWHSFQAKDRQNFTALFTFAICSLKTPLCLSLPTNFNQLCTERTSVSSSSIETSLREQDFTDQYQLERFFIKQLRSGNTNLLQKMITNLAKISQSTLSKNALVQNKYRIVSLITLMTRASVQSGCPATATYRLSDRHIQILDTIEAQQDFIPYIEHLITDFVLLHKQKAKKSSSDVVNKALEYIYQHIYEPINNQDIASAVGVHPSYLSTIVKKTMKQSLHHLISEAKIEEAKYILTYTDLSFRDITELLHFSNQSHFCKVFKEFTLLTPKEYRLTYS